MPKKLFITNERMLQLVAWSIDNGIADTETEFYEKIGFTRNNISLVRSGATSFTKEHILEACKITGASADYIFGFTNTMQRKKPTRAMELLKEAVSAIDQELRRK